MAIINATGVTRTEVSNAITSASDGDTVVVPAGSANWATPITITKFITLQGAGIGQTVITNTAADNFTYVLIFNPTTPATNGILRLTGFTIDGSNSSGVNVINSNVSVKLTKLRIDHCRFVNCKQYATKTNGEVRGVIDHNEFENNYIGTQIIGNEGNSWSNFPLNEASADSLYIENNTYTYSTASAGDGFATESGQGGRYVFRYNTLTQTTNPSAFTELHDVHGNQSDYPNERGSLGFECYNNTYTLLTANHRWVNFRGGTGKIFNNTVTKSSNANASLEMTEYDAPHTYNLVSTWPGFDPVKDTYWFNNKVNGSDKNPTLGESGDEVFIQEGRDYWLPTYGLDANKSATPSVGDTYGATDTGKIYKCETTNTWTLIYTPYSYPHPFIAETDGTSSTTRVIITRQFRVR
jgi:hypothetical protein